MEILKTGKRKENKIYGYLSNIEAVLFMNGRRNRKFEIIEVLVSTYTVKSSNVM